MHVGSLFTGIGGFDLGFERAGMRVAWQCEADPFCRAVLRKHWPAVPCFPDVRELRATDVVRVDLLCGGFPCQDISAAGKGAGLAGARSGLWAEFARLIGELRPRYVVVENVPTLRSRGLGRILGEMAALGYDAEWDCVPACALGAPHRRDRIWIIAYPERSQLREQPGRRSGPGGPSSPLAAVDGQARAVAYPEGERREPGLRARKPLRPGTAALEPQGCLAAYRSAWSAEPGVGRVADGVPTRVHRLRALGNALVPQIAEWIGRRILEWEAGQ